MDEFVETIQGEVLTADEGVEFLTAVIGAVNAEGVTLIFPGEEEAGEKNYKCNAAVKLKAGDRVKVIKDSGTYLVEYPVGAPNSALPRELPDGGSTGQILRKTDGGAAWGTETRELPTGGSTGQVLTRTSTGSAWQTPDSALPSGGNTGQVLTKTSSGAAWQNAPTELPSGGSVGQVLTKTITGTAWQAAAPTQIKNGSYSLSINYSGQCVNTGSLVACSSGGTLGFFGKTGAHKTALTTSATLSQLITALQSYGLV